MAEQVFNAGNTKQVKTREADEKAYQRKLIEDLKKVLGTTEGIRYIYHLLEECRVFSEVYSINHAEMSFREGQRQVGLKLLQEVEAANPDALLSMLAARSAHGNQQ